MNTELSNFQGAFPDGEWDFSRMYSTEDHHIDFTTCDQFPGQFNSFPGENDGGLQFTTNHLAFSPINPELISNVNESLFYSWNSLNPDFHLVSQENSSSSNCSTSVFAPNSSNHESYFLSDSMSIDVCIVDEKNSNSFVPVIPDISMTEAVSVSENISNSDNYTFPAKELLLKRKFDIPESEVNPSYSATKKKIRVTRDATKSKKNEKAKKNSSPNSKKEEEEKNGGEEGQSSSSCSSEEDNASQEALNSSGKARASRGSATDPQSLYARKRRERINERLRILQKLVPNGTKVDISTMLEEAVQYVKFLQLQIKLLSSDDLWMYAPIAYNGMDIGLNQKISMLL